MSNWNLVSDFIIFSTKGITPKYVDDSSILVLNQKCIRNNRIDYSFARYTDDSKDFSETKFVQRGDILMNSTGTGTAGRCAFVSELPMHKRLIVDSHILILRCRTYSIAQCLNYILYSFENTLMSFMTGSSGQSELDKVVLLNLKIKIPNDSFSQQKIANVLSTLDSKIELNNRINAELEQMAKTLYDYWFVQFDFPFDFAQGKPNAQGKPYKSSGGKMVWCPELKREVPEGWELKSLGEIADCNKWTINSKSKVERVNYLDTSNLTRNVIENIIPINISCDTLPSRAQRIIAANDILFSTVRPNQCHYGIIKEPIPNLIASSGFAHLRSKNERISNDLIYFYLTSSRTIERLQQIAESSVSAYPSVSPNDILELKVCLPTDKQLLDQINQILNSINSKISNLLKENQHLFSLRDWLLPMLMNGQVKVGEAKEYKIGDERLGMVAEP